MAESRDGADKGGRMRHKMGDPFDSAQDDTKLPSRQSGKPALSVAKGCHEVTDGSATAAGVGHGCLRRLHAQLRNHLLDPSGRAGNLKDLGFSTWRL